MFGTKPLGQHHHHQDNPWETAPPWAIELGIGVSILLKDAGNIMAQEDDLNNAVTALATGFAALDVSVQAQLKAMADANAASSQPNPAISQAIANIAAVTSKMSADAAALTAAIPAATTVAPAPVAPAVVDVTPTVSAPAIATPPVTAPDATPASTPPSSATTQPGAPLFE